MLTLLIPLLLNAALLAEPPASPPPPPPPAAPAAVASTPIDVNDPTFKPRCNTAADYSAKFSGQAVLVMVRGEVVFERYDNNWSADKPHPLASGSKSFSGVAAMCAIQDGLISSLDEKICDTITEWKNDPKKSQITLRHLLTLSSGLDAKDPALDNLIRRIYGNEGAGNSRRGGGGLGEALEERRREPDKFKAAVDTKMTGTPGGQFEYGPSHYHAFGEFMNRKLAKSGRAEKTIDAYMKARIFDPIGLKFPPMGWGRDMAGNPNLPGGARLTAREWAKFGELVRLHGAWKQPDGSTKQVISWQNLQECFKPSAKNKNYGLTWWLLDSDASAAAEADSGGARSPQFLRQAREAEAIKGPDGKPLTVYMAAGLGKQRLYILPQFDLVVVRFAEMDSKGLGFENAPFLGPILGLRAPSIQHSPAKP